MTPLQIALAVVTVIQSGATGVLVWVFRRVISGELVSRKVLEDVRSDRDERVQDANETAALWHAALIRSEDARTLQTGQVQQLLETGRISEALLRSLPRPPDREPTT